MKKIKSIKHLRAEKKLIKLRQAALEEKIRTDWKELKEQLKPGNIAKDTIETVLRKKAASFTNDGGLIKSTLSYGITLLAGKLAETAGSKFSKLFNRHSGSAEKPDQNDDPV